MKTKNKLSAVALAIVSAAALSQDYTGGLLWPSDPYSYSGFNETLPFTVADQLPYANYLGQYNGYNSYTAPDPYYGQTLNTVWIIGNKQPDPYSVSPGGVMGYFTVPTYDEIWAGINIHGPDTTAFVDITQPTPDPYLVWYIATQQSITTTVASPPPKVRVPTPTGTPDQTKADARCSPLASDTTRSTTSQSSPEQRFASAQQMFAIMLADNYGNNGLYENIRTSVAYDSATNTVCYDTAHWPNGKPANGQFATTCTTPGMQHTFSMIMADGFKFYYLVDDMRPPHMINMGEAPFGVGVPEPGATAGVAQRCGQSQ